MNRSFHLDVYSAKLEELIDMTGWLSTRGTKFWLLVAAAVIAVIVILVVVLTAGGGGGGGGGY